jgi:imidazolonepropionase-like amidohydrolase
LLVQSGLTPLAAVQAATINAAAALRKGDDLGALEPGYFADLSILEADPLKDIGNTQKINLVIAAGRSYSPNDLLNTLNNSH